MQLPPSISNRYLRVPSLLTSRSRTLAAEKQNFVTGRPQILGDIGHTADVGNILP